MNYGYYGYMNYGYYGYINYGYVNYGHMNYDESLDMNPILYKSRRSEIDFIAITYSLQRQSILAIVKLYWKSITHSSISQTTTKGNGFYLHMSARLYTPELKKNIARGTTDPRVDFSLPK